jgi:hypothetical protein
LAPPDGPPGGPWGGPPGPWGGPPGPWSGPPGPWGGPGMQTPPTVQKVIHATASTTLGVLQLTHLMLLMQ